MAPIGLARKSTAPALTAATAAFSDPRALVAINGVAPRVNSAKCPTPPIVSMSAMKIGAGAGRRQCLVRAFAHPGGETPERLVGDQPGQRPPLRRIGVDDQDIDRCRGGSP